MPPYNPIRKAAMNELEPYHRPVPSIRQLHLIPADRPTRHRWYLVTPTGIDGLICYGTVFYAAALILGVFVEPGHKYAGFAAGTFVITICSMALCSLAELLAYYWQVLRGIQSLESARRPFYARSMPWRLAYLGFAVVVPPTLWVLLPFPLTDLILISAGAFTGIMLAMGVRSLSYQAYRRLQLSTNYRLPHPSLTNYGEHTGSN